MRKTEKIKNYVDTIDRLQDEIIQIRKEAYTLADTMCCHPVSKANELLEDDAEYQAKEARLRRTLARLGLDIYRQIKESEEQNNE